MRKGIVRVYDGNKEKEVRRQEQALFFLLCFQKRLYDGKQTEQLSDSIARNSKPLTGILLF